MEKTENSIGVVVKPNGEMYASYGNNKYQNLSTGVSGEIDKNICDRIFRFNPEATYFYNTHEVFGEMVRRLNLKVDKTI